MSSSRRKTPTWSGLNLNMTRAHPDSADSSTPVSPTQKFTRTHSTLSNDERTPLLPSAGRSRLRLQSAAMDGAGTTNARPPRLSRHESHNGRCLQLMLASLYLYDIANNTSRESSKRPPSQPCRILGAETRRSLDPSRVHGRIQKLPLCR